MNTVLSAALLVSGFSDQTPWKQVESSKDAVWLLDLPRAEQRDTELASLSFNDAERFYVATRGGVFWMSPTWTDTLSSLPDTHPGEDLAYVMAQRGDGSCVLLLPLPSPAQRGRLYVAQGLRAGLRTDPDPKDASSAPAFLLAHGEDPIQLLTSAIAVANERLPTFRLRKEKPDPAFIDHLGWCTWDAYYREVTAERVETGVATLEDGGHEPGFLIIDDGWQDVSENWGLRSFGTDNERFPDGLAPLCKRLRAHHDLRWIGVWHTLQGYWGGVDPQGALSERFQIETTHGAADAFEGWGNQFAIEARNLVDPEQISLFYQDYYQQLAAQGINLVKVDNQAQLELFSGREDLPENAIRDAYQQSLQGAAAARMEGNLLHCMHQSSDIYFQLSASNLARNSDDFYPQKDDAAQIKHIVQNAFNAAFTSHFAVPDWDMFQTYHRRAAFHAIARVISGGPLYISDQPDKTDHALLDQLVIGQNQIPRFAQAGVPIARQFFDDPRQSDGLLVVANAHQGSFGAVALFNCHDATEQTDSFSVSDLPGFNASKYSIFDYDTQTLQIVEATDTIERKLPATGATLYGIAPLVNGHACLGTTGKLNGLASVQSVTPISEGAALYQVRHGGSILFAGAQLPARVTVNGNAITPQPALDGNGFTVDCPQEAEVEIVVFSN